MKFLLEKFAAIVALTGIAGCCYCGTPTYDAKVYESWAKYADAVHQQAIEIGPEGSGITMQMPLMFPKKIEGDERKIVLPITSVSKMNKVKGLNNKDEVRFHLPLVNRNDLKATYEVWIEPEGVEPGVRWPVYCYVLMPNATTAQARTQLREDLATALTIEGQKPAWETKELFEDGKTSAQLLTVTGTFPYAVRQANSIKKDIFESPGRLDLYLVSQGAKNVVVGWRSPNSIAEPTNFFAAAEQAVKTITFTEDAATTPTDGNATTPPSELVTKDVPGTNLQISLPTGWNPLSTGTGFVQGDGNATNSGPRISFYPRNETYQQLVDSNTADNLKAQSITILQQDNVTVNNQPATIYLYQGPTGSYWNLVFSGNAERYIVTANWTPPSDETAKQTVRNALLSITAK